MKNILEPTHRIACIIGRRREKACARYLIGIAQEKGFLNIHQRTSDILGDKWSGLSPDQEDLITIWHHITMTTGLNPIQPDCTDPSFLTYLADAGSRWYYHNAPYNLTRNILETATGQSINVLTNAWIKSIIGMETGIWIPVDYKTVFFSRARDMARFGILMQNGGIWDTMAVVSDQTYLDSMIRPSQDLNPSYGYLWWLNGQSNHILPGHFLSSEGFLAPDAPADVIVAAGAEGQLVSIAPSLGLVIVRQGLSEGYGQCGRPLTQRNLETGGHPGLYGKYLSGQH